MPERNIDWNQLMAEALTMPGNMQGVYDRFYPYSLANIILLRLQGVREPIATYKRWQSLGRQVLSGAKAKEIIVPLMRKVAVEPDPAQPDLPRYLVFAVSLCHSLLCSLEGSAAVTAMLPK